MPFFFSRSLLLPVNSVACKKLHVFSEAAATSALIANVTTRAQVQGGRRASHSARLFPAAYRNHLQPRSRRVQCPDAYARACSARAALRAPRDTTVLFCFRREFEPSGFLGGYIEGANTTNSCDPTTRIGKRRSRTTLCARAGRVSSKTPQEGQKMRGKFRIAETRLSYMDTN